MPCNSAENNRHRSRTPSLPSAESSVGPGRAAGSRGVTVDRGSALASLVAAEAAGRVDRFHSYQEWAAPEFRIKSGAPLLDIGVNGEPLHLPPPLVFKSLPGALRIQTPIDADASPAALPGESLGLSS